MTVTSTNDIAAGLAVAQRIRNVADNQTYAQAVTEVKNDQTTGGYGWH